MTRRPRQQHGSARRLHPHERDFWCPAAAHKSARLTRLDTSNFDSMGNLEAENNNQVT